MTWDVVLQAHLYTFNNIDEVQPYLFTHKRLINEKLSIMNEKWLLKEHKMSFIDWFNDTVSNDLHINSQGIKEVIFKFAYITSKIIWIKFVI